MLRTLAAFLLSISIARAQPGIADEIAKDIIAPLIDPAKLDTLEGERAANRRLRLICYHLHSGRRIGLEPADIITKAQEALRMEDKARAEAVKESLLRTWTSSGSSVA